MKAQQAAEEAEQQTILDSLRLESATEARCCRRQEMEAQQATEEEEMLAYMDEVEQEEEEKPEPSYARPPGARHGRHGHLQRRS